MDFISDRTMNLTQLALDGLMARQKAISANIANSETPGYQRKDVIFEDQLTKIIQQEEVKDSIKKANSLPLSVNNTYLSDNSLNSQNVKAMLAKNSYDDFQPITIDDENSPVSENGNNVNIEQEMAELSKNASKYMILTELESKSFTKMSEVIKGAM